jgi:hypothetical protein
VPFLAVIFVAWSAMAAASLAVLLTSANRLESIKE